MNIAIISFAAFVVFTFALAIIATRRAGKSKDFYAAGQDVGGVKNGLALAGDMVSAAGFLGVTGAIFLNGFDGLLLPISALLAWPLMLFLFAERMRNLGRYTFIDVLSYRLQGNDLRIAAAVSALCINTMYAITQLVGGGALLSLLLGISYMNGLITITILMAVFVAMGGMLVATWIQMIKAALMILGALVLSVLVLGQFGFSPEALLTQAAGVHPKGAAILAPGAGYFADPVSGISLSLSLALGTAAMPHLLMRFFTAPSAHEAKRAAFFGTIFVGAFYTMLIVMGYGAIALVYADPSLAATKGMPVGGINMVVMHMTRMVGGEAMFGFMAAVTFATILAVVSGIAISSAATISHDLARVLAPNLISNERKELLLSRISAVLISLVALGMSIALEGQNVAILGTLALGMATSTNLPVLLLCLYWKGLTPRAATAGMWVGLVSSVALIALSPMIMIDVLKMDFAIANYTNGTLLSLTAAVITIIFISLTDKSARALASQAAFDEQERLAEVGVEGPRKAH